MECLKLPFSRYRLAFDNFQRDVTGSDLYLTVPSVPNRILESGFNRRTLLFSGRSVEPIESMLKFLIQPLIGG